MATEVLGIGLKFDENKLIETCICILKWARLCLYLAGVKEVMHRVPSVCTQAVTILSGFSLLNVVHEVISIGLFSCTILCFVVYKHQ